MWPERNRRANKKEDANDRVKRNISRTDKPIEINAEFNKFDLTTFHAKPLS